MENFQYLFIEGFGSFELSVCFLGGVGGLACVLFYKSFSMQIQCTCNSLQVRLLTLCLCGGIYNLEPCLPTLGNLNSSCILYASSVGWEDFRGAWLDEFVLG